MSPEPQNRIRVDGDVTGKGDSGCRSDDKADAPQNLDGKPDNMLAATAGTADATQPESPASECLEECEGNAALSRYELLSKLTNVYEDRSERLMTALQSSTTLMLRQWLEVADICQDPDLLVYLAHEISDKGRPLGAAALKVISNKAPLVLRLEQAFDEESLHEMEISPELNNSFGLKRILKFHDSAGGKAKAMELIRGYRALEGNGGPLTAAMLKAIVKDMAGAKSKRGQKRKKAPKADATDAPASP